MITQVLAPWAKDNPPKLELKPIGNRKIQIEVDTKILGRVDNYE